MIEYEPTIDSQDNSGAAAEAPDGAISCDAKIGRLLGGLTPEKIKAMTTPLEETAPVTDQTANDIRESGHTNTGLA